MKVKMVQITTNISQYQYDQLQKQSHKGKKKDKKPNELTFSEHFREAIDLYILELGKRENETYTG